MDLFLSRQEIRRLCRATVGDSTDESVSSQQTVQINALIDAAAHKVSGICRWLSLQRRATVGIDQEQQVMGYQQIEMARWLQENYPSQYLPFTYGTPADSFDPPDLPQANLQYVGPGNIVEVAIWDQKVQRYYKLQRAIIPVEHDEDRWTVNAAETALADAAAGDSAATIATDVAAQKALSVSREGTAQIYDPRIDGIHLWPILDKRYCLRVSYTISPSWEYHQQVLLPAQIDQIPSCVDALAIQYQVIADMYAQQGDVLQASRYCEDDNTGLGGKGRFWQRIRQLKGFQNTGERIALDDTCVMDEDRNLPARVIPRWDLRAIPTSNATFSGSD